MYTNLNKKFKLYKRSQKFGKMFNLAETLALSDVKTKNNYQPAKDGNNKNNRHPEDGHSIGKTRKSILRSSG